ncbi:ABC transporter permease [Pseudothauera rhizosphaerae]|uniref:ABC transporter permease subunit n=1 Tax=Pseudothauera rhizosphaerae TaxID=2565932 RepID=A0A4S4AYN6_9RHOO|nr:ABC transporter permease subunit [Pseudothauera rhizosphaerae]THF65276.1 ABC transporter permease subunit [Pseudothauera rhizosphaerae]
MSSATLTSTGVVPPGAEAAAPAAVAAPAEETRRARTSAGNPGVWWSGAIAALIWIAVGAVTRFIPNASIGFTEWNLTAEFGTGTALVGGLLLALAVIGPRLGAVAPVRGSGPWLIALAALTAVWQLLTAKYAVLPAPFFAPPQALVEVYLDDYARLADSFWNSLKLLAHGFFLGAAIGFLTGVGMGWSRVVGYWVHPLVRFIGPIPPTALLPLAFFFSPSSYAAAVFLIALATGFPVAVLTWSGVASVNRNYYDVARTMGASEWFLVLRVAIPAALPQVFVGLFMGLGGAFSVLVVAEMMGVKSGLGWYLTWAQGWASYTNMYAALIIMALLCSGLITLLFGVRDRVLSWQKGTLKW